MIVFSKGRAKPEIAQAAAVRRTAAISFYRKFHAENCRPPTQGEIAQGTGITVDQARSVRTWMKLHGIIKAVKK